MSGSPAKTKVDDAVDLTQTIKKLSIPIDTLGDVFEEPSGTALLICRDNDAAKWGPRWLSRSDLEATVISDPSKALQFIESTMPDIMLIEASLAGADGVAIYKTMLEAKDLDSAVVVLCSNAREISLALDAGAFDIARKPYDWQVISNRARHALLLKNRQTSLDASTMALQEALEIANTARERLRSQESFEPVTGLPNKSKFVDLLRRGMRAVNRESSSLAVIVIGFTRFRLVIEAMGQEHADRILTEIGRRLQDCVRNAADILDPVDRGLRTAAIASLDQFRFALMITSSGTSDTLAPLQQQLLDTLSRPIQISGQTVYLSTCLGVALYPQDADDVDSLLQRADNAMRDAQSRGGGFKYYCSEMDAAAARKLRIEHLLHEALDRDELSLVYQPIVDVVSGEITAAEALLRWQQPDGSYVQPEEFVVVAEESGLMIRTGNFALNQACEQLAQWRQRGLLLPRICVNVAKVQLMSSGFARSVMRILKVHGLMPADLELEISERGVLSGDYGVINELQELKNLGVSLSIDDFGTGDSAIAYLKELPVDVLKIDRSYVAGIIEDSKDAVIASAMVALGQRLKLQVIAEGVETEEQLNVLRELGCDAYQGYLCSKPLSAERFAAQFENSRNVND